jgi:hypothetical protein
VYTASSAEQVKAAKRVHDHAGASTGSVLFDRHRYAGKRRVYASQEDLDPHWIAEQRRAGCEFGLTDSGFIAAGDHDGLVRVLSQGAAIDRALVALPLAGQWLSMDAQVLVAEINRFGVPVAVMFEHAGDPLGREVAVRGFVQLLDETKVPILSLRGDTSGIGALALGGAAAAIGTTTGLRHIFPVKSGGRPATRAPSAFVPSAMCYRKLDTINHAIANSEFDTNFLCTCDICAGSRLDGLTEKTVVAHSLASQRMLARRVLEDPATALAAWVERCRHADSINQEIQMQIESTWPIPGFLGAWLKVLG